MKTRHFANTGQSVSEIALGCLQLGADWGHVSDNEALRILETAVESGITFLDTADVYGGGRSESLIRQFVKGPQEDLFIATKIGRKNYPGPYTPEVIRQHISDCRQRLGVEALDLVQLHCIPPQVMSSGEVFDTLIACKQDGLIKNFGAIVESMDEALMILDQPELTSLQIIFNIFRQSPSARYLTRRLQKVSASLCDCRWPVVCLRGSSRAKRRSPWTLPGFHPPQQFANLDDGELATKLRLIAS